ncbi:MAG: hypothetical protein A2X05_05325 [Bacteroidetes bacterium GWE2_41_25]|nr:MAG: hypothetical protein A2X03_09250 [Bacteroidetes bacterium GWA2_40_15]OFX92498.1 MAG: hypothetical protein A2X05_05325 [Bacteroidetes bacterium GWE2_41_25]OFY00519.1 MAG: hypothetical protein A2X06_00255 [Bacteroidetes bacterium GWC2_40_22]OFY59405.1 MAG: hypothetical protein A2X04_12590 [Bacteroidetes bacterium GWF2_41_9]HAM10500.1 hypothetical protein [Bacteroidales bacterium]
MNFIKKYKVILLILIPVVILVLTRALDTNHFRTDAKKLAEPSFSGSNIIIPDKVNQLNGEKLLIILGKDVIKHDLAGVVIKIIPPDSILYKENIRLIRKHDGPVILCSAENDLAIRIWMLLSQMGIENLYILSDDSEPEVLKYEFRPDTTVKPEL